MNERFDSFEELVMVTAASLAAKGYQAEHSHATQAEADAWAVDHVEEYLEDAWAWLVDQGERLEQRKKRKGR